MANNVFANGREINCKKGSGKSICAFPDVCWTPPDKVPPTPTGVPVPYPNTGMASDCTKGSKKVKVSGKEVILKNSSHFKKSMGDEAGVAQLKGMMTMKNRGKIYFQMWSMDVKVEGKNAVRHMDIGTHNHGSQVGNSPPWPYLDTMSVANKKKCAKEVEREKKACEDYKSAGEKDVCKEAGLSGNVTKNAKWADRKASKAKGNACIKARRCRLVPYSKKKDGVNGCCPSQTPDHLIPKSSFYKFSVSLKIKMTGWKNYSPSGAPCMCTEGGTNTHGSHGLRHTHHKIAGPKPGTKQTLSQQASLAAKGARKIFPGSKCSEACLKAQLEEGHKGMTSKGANNPMVKHSPSGSTFSMKDLVDKIKKLAPSSAPRA